MVQLVSGQQMFLEGKDKSFNIWLSKGVWRQISKVLTADKYPVMFGESERKQKWESGQHMSITKNTNAEIFWLFSNSILKAS